MRMWLRAGVLAGFLALTAAAVDWKARRPEGYVTDFARVIDPASRAQLERYCAEVEKATASKVALVVVPSLEREPADDVARTLYGGWNLGDRGVLVLLSRGDRRYAVHTGRAVALPSLGANILAEMRPALRTSNYPEALMAAAETGGNAVARARKVKLTASLTRRMHPSLLDGSWWIVLGIVATIAAAILFWRGPRGSGISRTRGAGGFGGFDSNDNCGAFGGSTRHTRASDW